MANAKDLYNVAVIYCYHNLELLQSQTQALIKASRSDHAVDLPFLLPSMNQLFKQGLIPPLGLFNSVLKRIEKTKNGLHVEGLDLPEISKLINFGGNKSEFSPIKHINHNGQADAVFSDLFVLVCAYTLYGLSSCLDKNKIRTDDYLEVSDIHGWIGELQRLAQSEDVNVKTLSVLGLDIFFRIFDDEIPE